MTLSDQDAIIEALRSYNDTLSQAVESRLFQRLGLASSGRPETDQPFLQNLLATLRSSRAPLDDTLHRAFGGREWPQGDAWADVRARAGDFQPVDRRQLDQPYFQSSHATTLAYDEIEALWEPIAEQDDWSQFEAKLAQTKTMAQAYGFSPISADDGSLALQSAQSG